MEYLLKLFVEVNKPKVESAIRKAAQEEEMKRKRNREHIR